MKFKLLIAITFLTILTSCSNDTSSGATETNYLPLAIGDYWTYNVTTNAQTQRDSLYVSNDTTINTKIYKKFKVKNKV